MRLRADRPGTTLVFNTHPNPELTPQSASMRAIAYSTKHNCTPFVRFEPWVAYGDRGAFFERFTLAMLTFPQSIETALAMRTRVYDYLWGGVPIVTSSAPGTDEIILRYGAGMVIKATHPDDYAEALLQLLEPASYQSAVAGTQAFVAGHQWSRTLSPLLEFVRAPRFYPNKQVFTSERKVPPSQGSFVDRFMKRFGAGS
jgi:hypothetical protein